jgi:glucose-1-phosphate thymidylyltransferase
VLFRSWGLSISYAEQARPDGVARALVIGQSYLAGRPSVLALGDNIFHGAGFVAHLKAADSRPDGATIFGYRVRDPERYGVVEFDDAGKVIGIEEKPVAPRSSYAIPGLYFYDTEASAIAANLKPSARGEYEITDLNREYLRRGRLHVEMLGRGTAWLDTGTEEALHDAATFVQAVEKRQGLKIAAPEEVAWRLGYISDVEFGALAERLGSGAYAAYLRDLLRTDPRTLALDSLTMPDAGHER